MLRELGFRDRHCATFRELLKVLPLEDQTQSEQARIEILQRVLMRLRARNLVDRTGTVWSSVGVGAEK